MSDDKGRLVERSCGMLLSCLLLLLRLVGINPSALVREQECSASETLFRRRLMQYMLTLLGDLLRAAFAGRVKSGVLARAVRARGCRVEHHVEPFVVLQVALARGGAIMHLVGSGGEGARTDLRKFRMADMAL